MSAWRHPCVVCRRERPAVFVKRLPPFGVLGFCEVCRRAVLEALLTAGDPHSLSELFALLRAEDAERREKRAEVAVDTESNSPSRERYQSNDSSKKALDL